MNRRLESRALWSLGIAMAIVAMFYIGLHVYAFVASLL